MNPGVSQLVGLSVAALALGTTFAPSGSAPSSGQPAMHAGSSPTSHPKEIRACASQRDNDNGKPVVTQNFERELTAYDSWGADDFTLAKDCSAGEIDVDGQYLGGSPQARSFNVTFYTNSQGNRPGTIVKIQRKLEYTTSDSAFEIMFKEPLKLTKGTYWVSVRANLDYNGGGLWGWNTNNTVRGAASVWMNPGDGFSTGCTRWRKTTVCIPANEGGDFSYAIR